MQTKSIIGAVGIFALFFLSSCVEIVEEIFLKKDGSGSYALTIDMSELFSDPFLKETMIGALQGEDGFFDSDESMEMDTITSFDEYYQEGTGVDREVWKNSQTRMIISEQAGTMKMEVLINFEKLSDIAGIIQRTGENDDQMMQLAEGGLLDVASLSFHLDKKTFIRDAVESVELAEELEDENTRMMMRMMLGDATMTNIYHMPGKVKNADRPGAVIDGSTVTLEYPVMDIFTGEADRQCTIKFK